MKIVLVTAHPFLPQMRGGMQFSADMLAKSLMAKGHEVAVLCALMPQGYIGLRGRLIQKLTGGKPACDHGQGYPVYRAWFPWEALGDVIRKERPDIAVVLASQPVKMAQAAQKAGLPVLMMLQDVEFDAHGGPFEALGNVPCVANSQFTADAYRKAYGVQPRVIHPIVEGSRYQTQSTRENVTFINPKPVKGLDIALAVARACPEIPFSFVEGWPLTAEEHEALLKDLSDLPNVTFRPSTKDMKSVYGRCKILLAPSRWQEAYGRVASEPQFSGIPVIASDRGGLPEAVGDGGILLDPDGPLEAWVSAVRRLWEDDAYYETLSQAALQHVRRPALTPEKQLDMWEEAIIAAADNAENKGE